METGAENAKATLEIYRKLEEGKQISIAEVKNCWVFITDIYSGLEKRVEKALSLFRYGDRNLFKKILWIKVQKHDNLVYVGFETKKGNETETAFERKFLGMSDEELDGWHQKSMQKMVISYITDIERTKDEIATYKKSIENGDKRIEELRKKLKKGKKK